MHCAKAIEVSEGEDQVNKSDLVLLFGLANRRGAAAAALEEMKTPAPSGPEALTVRIGRALSRESRHCPGWL